MAEVFEDFRIGNMTARNRLVRAATAESLCTKDGKPSKRMMDYYAELAKGGVGTIITGYAYVTPDGKPSERALSLSDGADMDLLRELVQSVHAQRIVDEDPNVDVGERIANLPIMMPDGRIRRPRHGKHEAPATGQSANRQESGTRALLFAQLVYGGSKSKLADDDSRWRSFAKTSAPHEVRGDDATSEDGELESALADDAGENDVAGADGSVIGDERAASASTADGANPAVPPSGADAVAQADGPAKLAPNVNIVGPSVVEHPATHLVPREASLDDIERIIAAFANAAARAKLVGFDGVEVHAAHGYLLSQFLDGRFNRRDDEFGGTLEGRARLAIECVRAVRSQVGEGYPVLVKLNSCDVLHDVDGVAGGLSEAESLQVAQWLVEAGASGIEVSGDWHGVAQENIAGEPFFGSFGTRLASRLGAEVPVIVTGGWRDRDTIERYLETTGIAGFGMSRPLICQTILPELWRAEVTRTCECISCNWCVPKNGIPCILRKGR